MYGRPGVAGVALPGSRISAAGGMISSAWVKRTSAPRSLVPARFASTCRKTFSVKTGSKPAGGRSYVCGSCSDGDPPARAKPSVGEYGAFVP
ncbi:hypothetical protein BIV23_16955 [Streptomyces monashensis]|uniref:Uncharacterized protein n=1 Tax=Streptomyces monashensis TaxID=1678012 RepID=A0A1S2QFR6_9ACTN|nr:hypothetical protein BIV23_16955 [Streptomyces monashensis]